MISSVFSQCESVGEGGLRDIGVFILRKTFVHWNSNLRAPRVWSTRPTRKTRVYWVRTQPIASNTKEKQVSTRSHGARTQDTRTSH